MKLTFLGAAGEVTGSQHLIETSTRRILLDCGLFQGRDRETRPKNERFLCSPQKLDAVILSHAHIDHCGNLPGLYKAGYRGPIYCTRATAEIAAVMLRDSARIQEEDARYLRRKHHAVGRELAVEPLYSEDDAKAVARRFEYVRFNEWEVVDDDFRFRLRHAGHILGAAMIELDLRENGEWKRVAFSGDLGRRDIPILPDPETIERCDALICESTYGDRVHPDPGDVRTRLGEIICEASRRRGKVIIPAFSLGRTQMLTYLLNDLRNQNSLCRVPVYVDSPLAVRLTDIYREHAEIMDSDVQDILKYDEDVFDFEGLHYVRSQDESMALNRQQGPFVVISAGGMCENGRVVHHLKHAISDEDNTVLIIGFQAEHSLGRQLVEHRQEVSIFGRTYPVRARIEVINGLSAHADAEDFRWWFRAISRAGGVGQVFLVHGEERAAQALSSLVAEHSDLPPVIPQFGQSFDI